MKMNTTELVKFHRLKRDLSLRDWQVVGVLESLWMFAAKNCILGDVGRFSNEDIAAALEWEGDADKLIAALTKGWLDPAPGEARLVCHDWYDHAPNFIARRINNLLGIGDAKVATSAGSAAWRNKVFGQETPELRPDVGAKVPGGSPPLDQKTAEKRPSRARAEAEPSQAYSSPSPPAPLSSAPDPEPLTENWEGVVGELISEGAEVPHRFVESCRANGCIPSEALEVIRQWRERKPHASMGLLLSKIGILQPNGRVEWPDCPEWERERSRADLERQQRKSADQRRDAEATREKIKRECVQLEADYGPALDAMSLKSVRELIAQKWPKESAEYHALLPAKRPIKHWMLRNLLLTELAENQKAKCEVGL